MYKILNNNTVETLESKDSFFNGPHTSPEITQIQTIKYEIKGFEFSIERVIGRGYLRVFSLTLRDYLSSRGLLPQKLTRSILNDALEYGKNTCVSQEVNGKTVYSNTQFVTLAREGTIEYDSYEMIKEKESNTPFTTSVIHTLGASIADHFNSLLTLHSAYSIDYERNYGGEQDIDDIVKTNLGFRMLEVYHDLLEGRELRTTSGILNYVKYLTDPTIGYAVPEAVDIIENQCIQDHQLWNSLTNDERMIILVELDEEHINHVDLDKVN